MKKISILLMSALFILAVSCSSPNNPNNPNGEGNNTKKITLAERAGTYTGKLVYDLVIVLDGNATVTSIKVGGQESIENPIKIGKPSDEVTTVGPFDASVNMGGKSAPAKVKITFNSDSDASQGATAKVQIAATPDQTYDESKASEVKLSYTK